MAQQEELGPVVEATAVADASNLALPNGIPSQLMHISGWVADDNSTNHTTTIPHTLGRTPNWCQVWFTSNGKVDYLVSWSWSGSNSGNPVTISANANAVFLEITKGAPLHGTWDGANGNWTHYKSGYWRIAVG